MSNHLLVRKLVPLGELNSPIQNQHTTIVLRSEDNNILELGFSLEKDLLSFEREGLAWKMGDEGKRNGEGGREKEKERKRERKKERKKERKREREKERKREREKERKREREKERKREREKERKREREKERKREREKERKREREKERKEERERKQKKGQRKERKDINQAKESSLRGTTFPQGASILVLGPFFFGCLS